MALHVSETDAARDFVALLAKVRDGEEVIIRLGLLPVAILRPPLGKPLLLSESIGLATQHREALGYEPVMDDEFAKDLQEVIRLRYQRPRRATFEWDSF